MRFFREKFPFLGGPFSPDPPRSPSLMSYRRKLEHKPFLQAEVVETDGVIHSYRTFTKCPLKKTTQRCFTSQHRVKNLNAINYYEMPYNQGILRKSGNKFLTTRFFHQVVEKGS